MVANRVVFQLYAVLLRVCVTTHVSGSSSHSNSEKATGQNQQGHIWRTESRTSSPKWWPRWWITAFIGHLCWIIAATNLADRWHSIRPKQRCGLEGSFNLRCQNIYTQYTCLFPCKSALASCLSNGLRAGRSLRECRLPEFANCLPSWYGQ